MLIGVFQMLSVGKREHPAGSLPQVEVVHGVAQPHVPPWQVSPPAQLPQEPPQPSLPQAFPVQSAMQRAVDPRECWPRRRFARLFRLLLPRAPAHASPPATPSKRPSPLVAAPDSMPST